MLFWGIWVGRKAKLVCSWSSLLVSTSNAHMSAGTCLPFENSSQVLVCADRGQRPFHTVRTHLLLMQLLLHPPPMPCKLSQLTAGNITSLPLLHRCPAQPPSASPECPLHSASNDLYPPPSLYYLDIKWIADYWRSISKRECYRHAEKHTLSDFLKGQVQNTTPNRHSLNVCHVLAPREARMNPYSPYPWTMLGFQDRFGIFKPDRSRRKAPRRIKQEVSTMNDRWRRGGRGHSEVAENRLDRALLGPQPSAGSPGAGVHAVMGARTTPSSSPESGFDFQKREPLSHVQFHISIVVTFPNSWWEMLS